MAITEHILVNQQTIALHDPQDGSLVGSVVASRFRQITSMLGEAQEAAYCIQVMLAHMRRSFLSSVEIPLTRSAR